MDVALLVLFFALLIVLALCVLAAVYLIGAAFGATVENRNEPVLLAYRLPADEGNSVGLGRAVADVAMVMESAKYELVWANPTVACFERRYWPPWLIVLVIVLFPLGLALLAWRATASIVFHLLPATDGDSLVLDGKLGHRPLGELRDALANVGEPERVAGWYQDEAGTERYWDGEGWTEQTRAERVVVGPRMKSLPPS